MENINYIHDDVFEFLEEEYQNSVSKKSLPFLFTLRRSNQQNRLKKGYWFYGNENYIAISFWSGMDWKNKTPNIFFRITTEGKTYLTFTCKDSIQKAEFCKKYFVKPLELKFDGSDRWSREYIGNNYMASLQTFILNEKIIIDQLLRENIAEFVFEDKRNQIGLINEIEFQKWYTNVKKYRDEDGDYLLPFSLTAFSVERYNPIEKANFGRIPKNTPFIFLTGENGSGKTSLLKALATAIGNKFYSDKYDPDNSSWLINFSLNIDGKTNRFKISRFEALDKKLKTIPFASFGPSRLITQDRYFGKRNSNDVERRMHALHSIFRPDAILKDINRWIIKQLSDLNPENEKDSSKLRYENIKQMLVNIIPNLYDIREVPWDGTQELLYFEADLEQNKIEKGVNYNLLSSGLRSLIAMLGDMMLRLFEQQKEIIDPAELAGIVLIDEIDIHLHPNWQRRVPKILSDNFPKIQFIVTTHSPIPLLGIPPNSKIYNISRTAEKGVSIKSLSYINVANLLPNTILTSPIFAMDDLVSVYNKDITKVNVDDSIEDTDFFDLLDKKLRELSKKEELFNKKYFD